MSTLKDDPRIIISEKKNMSTSIYDNEDHSFQPYCRNIKQWEVDNISCILELNVQMRS